MEYDTSKDKIVLPTQADGTVIFENIPYDVYYVEIEESNEFKELKEVNLSNFSNPSFYFLSFIYIFTYLGN